MPANLSHVRIPTIMGSWPFTPRPGAPFVQPQSLVTNATIVGTARATDSGYAIGGMSFYLYVDARPRVLVSFAGPGAYTLDGVAGTINTAIAPNPPVAFADNGFLLLRSPTLGSTSYLRLETDASNDVFYELGLLPETTSRGGDIAPAYTVDPDRQVATPGQLSFLEGEPFSARAFNRALLQLGVNTDRSAGLLDNKRIAVRNEISTTYTTSATPGVTLLTTAFVGKTIAPTVENLESLFSILDSDGKEIVKENSITLNTFTGSTELQPENGLVFVRWTSATPSFVTTDPKNEIYVQTSGFTGAAAALNGKPLKVLAFYASSLVVISTTDPTSGVVYQPDVQTGLTFLRLRIDTVKCQVDGVYSSSSGSRVEGVPQTKQASTPVTRVEANNRIYCAGASFASVVAGDEIAWSGYGSADPYTNNGTYKVVRKIDNHTLELAASDWGPVFLNMRNDVALGNIVARTDGSFYTTPFLRFKADGAIPANGQAIRVVFGAMSTLRDATDSPNILLGDSIKYSQEADDVVQKAVLAILGPSVTSITDWVFGDRRVNLETINTRLNHEHDPVSGRHLIIRPDIIDMHTEVMGETVILRNAAAEDSSAGSKAVLYSSSGLRMFQLSANGHIGIGLTEDYDGDAIDGLDFGPGLGVGVRMASPANPQATVISGSSSLSPGTYYYRIAAVDGQGAVTVATTEVSAQVTGTNNQRVVITADEVFGAAYYMIYRSTIPGGPYAMQGGTPLRVCRFYDLGTGWAGADYPVSETWARSSMWGGTGANFIPKQLAIGGSGFSQDYHFSIMADGSVEGLFAFAKSNSNHDDAQAKISIGAPMVSGYMDDGFGGDDDDILRLKFDRWDGANWINKWSLRCDGYQMSVEDEAGNNGFSLRVNQVGIPGAPRLYMYSESGSLPLMSMGKPGGDYFHLINDATDDAYVFGIDSATENLYLHGITGTARPLIVNANGRVGIGYASDNPSFGAVSNAALSVSEILSLTSSDGESGAYAHSRVYKKVLSGEYSFFSQTFGPSSGSTALWGWSFPDSSISTTHAPRGPHNLGYFHWYGPSTPYTLTTTNTYARFHAMGLQFTSGDTGVTYCSPRTDKLWNGGNVGERFGSAISSRPEIGVWGDNIVVAAESGYTWKRIIPHMSGMIALAQNNSTTTQFKLYYYRGARDESASGYGVKLPLHFSATFTTNSTGYTPVGMLVVGDYLYVLLRGTTQSWIYKFSLWDSFSTSYATLVTGSARAQCMSTDGRSLYIACHDGTTAYVMKYNAYSSWSWSGENPQQAVALLNVATYSLANLTDFTGASIVVLGNQILATFRTTSTTNYYCFVATDLGPRTTEWLLGVLTSVALQSHDFSTNGDAHIVSDGNCIYVSYKGSGDAQRVIAKYYFNGTALVLLKSTTSSLNRMDLVAVDDRFLYMCQGTLNEQLSLLDTGTLVEAVAGASGSPWTGSYNASMDSGYLYTIHVGNNEIHRRPKH